MLQGLTRNPLAEPGLLGVSTGAALGAVLAIYFGVTTISGVAGPMLGLVGALAASLLTFGLGQGGGTILLHDSDHSAAPKCWVAMLSAVPGILSACTARGWSIGPLRDHGL